MKIVFVGNYWPYVFGGTRIYRMAPLFEKMGHEVHVFTMPLNKVPDSIGNLHLHQVPYRGDIFEGFRQVLRLIFGVKDNRVNIGMKELLVKKVGKKSGLLKRLLPFIFNKYQEIFGYPDTEKKWESDLKQSLVDFLRESSSDQVVLISEYPVISHIVVACLKEKYNFFWIADFVDLWSLNHNYPYGILRKYLDIRLERKTLKKADYLVTTSEIWAKKLRTIHPGKSVFSVPHGFSDSELMIELHSNLDKKNYSCSEGKLKIVYAGRIYPEMQDLSIFFESVSNTFINNNFHSFVIEFYSSDEDYISASAKEYMLENYVSIYSMVPRDEIMNIMKSADLLLLIGVNKNNKLSGSIPSKIYDYIIANKPILVVGGVKGDEIEELIYDTRIGNILLTSQDCDSYLNKYLADYISCRLDYQPNYSGLLKYSQKNQALKFLSLIDFK